MGRIALTRKQLLERSHGGRYVESDSIAITGIVHIRIVLGIEALDDRGGLCY